MINETSSGEAKMVSVRIFVLKNTNKYENDEEYHHADAFSSFEKAQAQMNDEYEETLADYPEEVYDNVICEKDVACAKIEPDYGAHLHTWEIEAQNIIFSPNELLDALKIVPKHGSRPTPEESIEMLSEQANKLVELCYKLSGNNEVDEFIKQMMNSISCLNYLDKTINTKE